MKIINVGDSNYIIIPCEYIKVFKLKDFEYDVEVKDGGKQIIYTQTHRIEKEVK